jgi:hypothetical protein
VQVCEVWWRGGRCTFFFVRRGGRFDVGRGLSFVAWVIAGVAVWSVVWSVYWFPVAAPPYL